jgi:hypothetical protein
MNSLYTNYCAGDKSVAKMLTIYIEEAHPIDEWILPESEPITTGEASTIKVHQNIQERLAAAKSLIKNRNLLCETVCDSFDRGNANDVYDAWPERLYIIVDQVIVYKGGYGPFDYKLHEVQDWLAEKYGLRGESLKKVLK